MTVREAMRITFDTNTLDKVVRPQRYPKDPFQADYFKIHGALRGGAVRGYFSETLITLEGVQIKDRVQTFGSTRVAMQPLQSSRSADGREILQITAAMEQNRKPLHPEHLARVQAALSLGLRCLRAPPRIGWIRVEDPAGTIFEPDDPDGGLSKRLDRSFELGEAMKQRGLGQQVGVLLGQQFASRDNPNELWFDGLQRAKDIHEERAVSRAIAEWADGDTAISHYAYANDYLCSEDYGQAAGRSSIFDSTNRAWLEAVYGIKFMTLIQLAGMV
jgi:hypothetical protein